MRKQDEGILIKEYLAALASGHDRLDDIHFTPLRLVALGLGNVFQIFQHFFREQGFGFGSK